MIELFANLSYGLAIAFGLVLIFGFLLVASLTDKRNVRHPGGARGRFKDERISIAPLAPMLGMILTGALMPAMRDQGWWFPILMGGFALSMGGSFLPAVRRAKARIAALRQPEPAQ